MLKELLMNPKEPDRVKAISIGFGVFMGIVPIWGFQLAVGIPLAFLFKLNKALFVIAANISIPPMIPIILFLSHKTGKIWMGEKAVDLLFSKGITLHALQNSFLQYLIGAVTLAVFAGVGFGAVTYLLLRAFKKPSFNSQSF
jgi:uncharacterized protein (DUF2062 family)